MVTLRCTRKLQAKLRGRPFQEGAPSTTTLGDWYGNLFSTRHARLVMFVSEKSRLAVLLHARDFPTLAARFREAVVDLLRQLAVSEEAIQREAEAMAEVTYAPTRSRSVLGTMNDYDRSLRWMLEAHPAKSLNEHALRLSGTPCSPLEYDFPDKTAQFLLSEWRNWSFKTQVQ